MMISPTAAPTLGFSLYPLTQGKFFFYHWVPFYYFAILLSSLGFVEGSRLVKLEPIFLLLLLVLLAGNQPRNSAPLGPGKILRRFYHLGRNPGATLSYIHTFSLAPPKRGRVDEMAAFLKSRLQPGDRVQPLDWTGGALQAMLLARVRPATPFIYDVEFYHHVSNPYIQSLRRRFIAGLRLSQPRFIIEVVAADKPFVQGQDAAAFAELSQILQSDYAVALEEKDFKIYRRK